MYVLLRSKYKSSVPLPLLLLIFKTISSTLNVAFLFLTAKIYLATPQNNNSNHSKQCIPGKPFKTVEKV